MSDWYFAYDGKQKGPLELSELQEMSRRGDIRPETLVWREGMEEWVPARTVDLLSFDAAKAPSSAPPPIPAAESEDFATKIWKKAVVTWKTNKIAFFGVGFGILLPVQIVLNSLLLSGGSPMDMGLIGKAFFFFTVISSLITFGFLIGLIGSVLVWLSNKSDLEGRQSRLQAKWEPVSGDGSWIVFFEDGGYLRSDGFSAKYSYDPQSDDVTISAYQLDQPVTIKVVTLSSHELVLSSEGTSLHYRKGSTITERERRKAAEEFARKWGERAKTTAAVAGAVAVGAVGLGVLVLGGLGAAGVATAASSGPSMGSSGGSAAPSTTSGPARQTPSTGGASSSPPPQPARMPAIQGPADVVDQTPTSVTVRKKCERCGSHDSGTTTLRKGGATVTSWVCRCGHNNNIQVRFY